MNTATPLNHPMPPRGLRDIFARFHAADAAWHDFTRQLQEAAQQRTPLTGALLLPFYARFVEDFTDDMALRHRLMQDFELALNTLAPPETGRLFS